MEKRKLFLKGMKENRTLYIMIAPAVIYFLLFSYLPMGGIVLAFKKYTYQAGIFGSPWCGLDNFNFFFISGQAFLVTRNTILYNVAFLIVNTTMQVLVAILLAEMAGNLFKKAVQSMMLLPYFISWVIVGAFVYNFFNYEYGLMNGLLKNLGLDPINVYGMPSAWKYILVTINCWKWVGYGSVLYLATIVGIDVGLYEAAEIDGASIFKRIRFITLPLLKPTVIILTLLSVGKILRGDFSMFYQIVGNNGVVFNATDVVDTFVFRSLTQNSELGMAAAAGFYQSVLCFAIIMVTNYLVKKAQREYALF